MLIKLSYPYIFGILDCRPGESALSSSDVCVTRIESIKCLFGKDVVAKHSPSMPVIHGTSTSEFLAESISASSVGGLCGIGPTSASSLEVGSGARLVEAWLAGSPDIVRILLFLP